MALPVFRAAGAKSDGTTGAVTVDEPAGISIGDLEILFSETANGGTITITNDGGSAWAAMANTPINVTGSGGAKLYVFSRVRQSGDGDPEVTPGSDYSISVRLAYQAGTFDLADPFEGETSGSNTGISSSFSWAPGYSTSGPDRLVLVVSTTGLDSNTGTIPVCTNANLTALSSRTNVGTALGSGGGFGCTEGALAAAGAVGTFACTYGAASEKAYVSFAIQPSSSKLGFGTAGTVGAGASESLFAEAGRGVIGAFGAGVRESTSAVVYAKTGLGKVGTVGAGASSVIAGPLPLVNNPGIQIAFDDPMLATEPTWTRIDTVVKVSRWEIRRGRQGELEKTGTAEATIYVNDVDGHFQAGNAGSPYYQKLDGRQVTISRWNPFTNEWSSRFRGTIEEYSYDYHPSQVNTEVAIKCVGFMDYLAGAEMAPGQAGVAGAVPGTIFYEAQEVDDRILGILGNAEFPTDLAIVFSGNVVVSQSTYEPGYSFLAAIQDAVDAEFPGVSNFYEDRFGRLVFHGRHARFDPDTVAADAGPVSWPFMRWSVGDGSGIVIDPTAAQVRPPVTADRSVKLIINAATVTPLRDEGNELTQAEMEALVSRDAPSIAQHGVRSWSADDIRILEHKTNGDTDLDQAKKIADYYVANYKEARDRPRQITIKPIHPSDPRAEATWALMCDVDISDIVYVYVVAPGGGGIDGEFYVEGITETCRIGPPEFGFGEVTLDISPAAYYQTDVFFD